MLCTINLIVVVKTLSMVMLQVMFRVFMTVMAAYRTLGYLADKINK